MQKSFRQCKTSPLIAQDSASSDRFSNETKYFCIIKSLHLSSTDTKVRQVLGGRWQEAAVQQHQRSDHLRDEVDGTRYGTGDNGYIYSTLM